MKTLPAIYLIIFILLFTKLLNAQNQTYTAAAVIDLIIKNTGSQEVTNTVDIIKEGDPQTPVKGIITSMFATMDVLKKAVDKNCNLIIVHEPLYYNHLDQTVQFQNNAVFMEKKRYIDENKLVIWRFHDYIHRMKPDGILSGMVTKLGWGEYVVDGHLEQFRLPETTLKSILIELKKKFPKNAFYVVGDPDMKLINVRLAPGAPGSSAHIRQLEENNVDLLIAGESPQWETYEYMRDAVSQGRKKAIIFLGHIASEEAGMDYCSDWIRTFIKNIPVYFVEAAPSYWSY